MPVEPGPQNHPITGSPSPINTNPTPLDALFILGASVTLLLLLLWIATSLVGHPLFTDLPQWIRDLLSEAWKRVLVGSGTAATAAATLALRNWLYKTRPTPNYFVAIPVATAMLMVGLVAAEKILPSQEPLVHVPIQFTLQPLQITPVATESDNEILLEVVSPRNSPRIGLFPDGTDHADTYKHD